MKKIPIFLKHNGKWIILPQPSIFTYYNDKLGIAFGATLDEWRIKHDFLTKYDILFRKSTVINNGRGRGYRTWYELKKAYQ